MNIDIANTTKKAIVDDEHYKFLNRFRWSLGTHGYPITNIQIGKQRFSVRMHRFLTGFSTRVVDHINRDTLDNRESNLRVCSLSENSINNNSYKNRHGFRGVIKGNTYTKFKAVITKNRVAYISDYVDKVEEAAKIYDLMAIKLHGRFAVLNFPLNDYSKESICIENLKKIDMKKYKKVKNAQRAKRLMEREK